MSAIPVTDVDAEAEEMYTEVAQLARKWKDRGVRMDKVIVRLLQSGMIIAEAVGYECEDIVAFVKKFFSLPVHERPKAKA